MVGFDWDFMAIDRDLIIKSSGFNDLTLDFTETWPAVKGRCCILSSIVHIWWFNRIMGIRYEEYGHILTGYDMNFTCGASWDEFWYPVVD